MTNRDINQFLEAAPDVGCIFDPDAAVTAFGRMDAGYSPLGDAEQADVDAAVERFVRDVWLTESDEPQYVEEILTQAVMRHVRQEGRGGSACSIPQCRKRTRYKFGDDPNGVSGDLCELHAEHIMRNIDYTIRRATREMVEMVASDLARHISAELVNTAYFRGSRDGFADGQMAMARRIRGNVLMPPRREYVYYISDGSLVKIGKSNNVAARFAAIRRGQSVIMAPGVVAENLEVVRLDIGYTDREGELHRRFADARVAGEWFEITPQLREHMTAGDLDMRAWPTENAMRAAA